MQQRLAPLTSPAQPELDAEGRRVFTILAYQYGAVDRHGTAIRPGTWSNLGQEVPLQLWHDGRSWPIGKVLDTWETESGVWAKAIFDEEDPDAVKAMGKVERGFMGAVSVGFNPLHLGADKPNPVPHKELHGERDVLEFVAQELLELSLVNVPSSRRARIVRAFDLAERTGLDGAQVAELLDECGPDGCACRTAPDAGDELAPVEDATPSTDVDSDDTEDLAPGDVIAQEDAPVVGECGCRTTPDNDVDENADQEPEAPVTVPHKTDRDLPVRLGFRSLGL